MSTKRTGAGWSYVKEFRKSRSVCDHDSVFKLVQYVDCLQWLGCLVGSVLSFTSAIGSYEIKQFVMWQKGKYPVTALECTPVTSRSQSKEGCKKKTYQQTSPVPASATSSGLVPLATVLLLASAGNSPSHHCSHYPGHNFSQPQISVEDSREGRSHAWLLRGH